MTKIKVLPDSDNPIFIQRETGITHTAFQYEYRLFCYIRQGDVNNVKKSIRAYLENEMVLGRMSSDSLRQIKYWAVSAIAIAIHYAILGGMDETEAFNLSDIYIRKVDKLSNQEDIITYLSERALELTAHVQKARIKNIHTPVIRKCIHYININLHRKISVRELAEHCNLSEDYLASLFKKETKMSIHRFIMHEKLEQSKIMLMAGDSYSAVSYNLAFCSESHYIACFKKEYGMTPKEYIRQQSLI